MTQTIDYIREEVMPVLRDHGEHLSNINAQLARQNERIAHAEERGRVHSQKLNEHSGQLADVCTDVRVIQAMTSGHGKQQQAQRDKIWALSIELAKLAGAGSVAAIVVKAIELLSP
jgi:hypothetical protein